GKPELHVEQIWFFDQSRPRHLAVFKLTPAVDAEDIKTRVKLAKSTVIYAVARLSDGSTMIGHAPVKVTKGGC
ncbi:MAG: thiosulfate oxidation carrier protein SoxY, partial [Gammaproteobacteria bacterium]|nr:thiosulfate oxidation carrier protein SoxY [Gammaproteobacteria bacterium]